MQMRAVFVFVARSRRHRADYLPAFDRIARFAGAGTLIPITGFANAVVSPAIDSHSEGLILGVGAKIFSVAGPVLLYGTLAGSAWGVIYYIVTLVQRTM
jgi:stage V sporulation protein AC